MAEETRQIKSFVFFDLETTDLVAKDRPQVTQISLLAVHRDALLSAQANVQHFDVKNGEQIDISELKFPRIVDKLSLCLSPGKSVSQISAQVSGINDSLLHESQKQHFDGNLVQSLILFLFRQQQPACLVAHNGNRFDFKILKTELVNLSRSLPYDLLCVDTIPAFRYFDKDDNQGRGKQKRKLTGSDPGTHSRSHGDWSCIPKVPKRTQDQSQTASQYNPHQTVQHLSTQARGTSYKTPAQSSEHARRDQSTDLKSKSPTVSSQITRDKKSLVPSQRKSSSQPANASQSQQSQAASGAANAIQYYPSSENARLTGPSLKSLASPGPPPPSSILPLPSNLLLESSTSTTSQGDKKASVMQRPHNSPVPLQHKPSSQPANINHRQHPRAATSSSKVSRFSQSPANARSTGIPLKSLASPRPPLRKSSSQPANMNQNQQVRPASSPPYVSPQFRGPPNSRPTDPPLPSLLSHHSASLPIQSLPSGFPPDSSQSMTMTSQGKKKRKSFSKANILQRLFGFQPPSHNADADVIALTQMVIPWAMQFVQWADKNAVKFGQIQCYYTPPK